MKRIAVLCSGGDAPGMNAAIRAVVRRAIAAGLEVIGVRRGYQGLIQGDFLPMTLSSVGDIIHRGGTILYSARSEEFRRPAGQRAAVEQARAAGIDGLVVIGGDGSFRGARALAPLGLPAVGVPGTIDNDIWGTENCIGFDTCVNTVLDAVNRIRDTATALDRSFVIEVMGRESGFIALAAGLAGGAESIMIPEAPTPVSAVCERIQRGRERGKRHSLIIVAEGAGNGFKVAREIEAQTGLEVKVTVLGHIQRGGTPTAVDRILASRFGARAVELLMEGRHDLMVGVQGEELVEVPFSEVASRRRLPDIRLMELAEILAI